MSEKLKTIALCQLKPSDANVRKTGRHTGIEQLAVSIKANGLLENLVVQPIGNGKGKKAVYGVIAGSRRLAALRLLAKRRTITRDHPVPCLIKAGNTGTALETSLAENFERVDLHPADQFDAFAALYEQGASVDDIAAKFGVAPVFVQQRLKLAGVSPRLVSEYRSGAMTLEQLTAFTLSGDHLVQEQVWFDRPYADLPAEMIRRFLTSTQVEGGDRRARFVGAKAYEAAGGVIIRDLFDLGGEGYFADSQLLDQLVAETLAANTQELRSEGWQWVEVHLEFDYGRLSRFDRSEPVELALSKTEERRLAKLAKRYDELVAELEEVDGDAAELDQVSAEMACLQAKKEGWPNEVKALAGAVVALGPDGALKVVRGLLRPQRSSPSGKNGKGSVGKGGQRSNGYAESVLVELSAERTAALQEVVAGKPEIALTALLHALVGQLFYSGSSKGCLEFTASAVSPDRASEQIGASKAAQAFKARHSSWSERLPQQEQLWNWLSQLKAPERADLLAVCVASTVNALHGPAGRGARLDDSDTLAAEAGLDMKGWWSVTQTFLERLTKAEILAAVSEAVSTQEARRLEGLKKERMAKKAETLLAATGWLPVPLRTPVHSTEVSSQQ